MTKSRIAITFLCVVLALAGCDNKPDTTPAGKSAAAGTQPVSISAIQAQAKGFTVGAPMSVRAVYVFFDAQCPHCAQLWETAKPLKTQAKFIWIPVQLLNKTSEGQGAALLAAKDPVAAMNEHEASMAARTGGISAMGSLDEQRKIVARNTELFNRFAFASVPAIVGTNSKTGEPIVHEGALPTVELAQLLGLAPPQ